MSKPKIKVGAAGVLVLVSLILTGFIVVRIATSQNKQDKADEQLEKIADYQDSSDDKAENKSKRIARNKRYDKQGKVIEPPPQAKGGGMVENAPWMARLPALPVALSDTIIIGEVTDAQAYLSNDKSGVYTETTIKVDSIIKNTSSVSINSGETIETQRSGGKVRFLSGRIVHYRVYQQGIPKTGRRYVLFLKNHPEAQSFAVITGYELRAGRVLPLDGAGDSPKATGLPQFMRFKNMEETLFLSELQTAVREGVLR